VGESLVEVLHQPEQSRFVIRYENEEAILAYRLNEHQGKTVIDFYSTFVPPPFRGKGLAEKLVRTGITWAKEQGYELKASCWYAAKFIRGFTLIEIMVVLGIIAVLATLALPSFNSDATRKQVAESMALVEDYKKLVAYYQKGTQVFLQDNKEAGIPAPEKLLGNYVSKIELKDGAFHLTFGNKAHPSIKNKILSVQPIMVKDSPESPISWICGKAGVPEGMVAVGENRTDLEIKDLPLGCRI
jgi:type IV pilus assembly protein PilA